MRVYWAGVDTRLVVLCAFTYVGALTHGTRDASVEGVRAKGITAS